MILADTNVVSGLRRREREGRPFQRWAAETALSDLYISVVTVFELQVGVLRMERRDPDQGARLRRWLDEQVLAFFADRLLDIDLAIALKCAGLHVPDPRPDRDSLIAATALVHGLQVATRNVADFQGIGLNIVNPWET